VWGDSCEGLGYVERPYATGLVNVRLFRAQQRARHTNYPRLARKKNAREPGAPSIIPRAIYRPSAQSREPRAVPLPVQLQRELELPRIVCGGRLSGIRKQWTDSRHVETVRDVEHVDDEIHVHALAEVNSLRDAQIVEDRPGRDTGVASEVAIERKQRAVEVQ